MLILFISIVIFISGQYAIHASDDSLLYFDKSIPNLEVSLTAEDFVRARYSRFRLRPHSINFEVSDHDVLYRRDRFEGDIVGVDIKSIIQHPNQPHRTVFRSAVRNRWQTWPTARIAYTISSQYSSFSRSKIASALDEYSKRTCLRFVPRSDERDYLFITPDDGCYSTIGRAGGRQVVSLGAGCMNFGIIIHELMHSVGFFHEQSRPDRDDYVIVNWTNVAEDMKDQFIKYSYAMINTLGVTYDYGSVMHYSNRAFTRNGEATLVPRVNGVKIGQRDGFSQLDLAKINALYSCDDINVSPQSSLLEQTFATVTSVCVDEAEDCSFRKDLGYCESTPQWMMRYCKRTCGGCSTEGDTVDPKEIDIQPNYCKDEGLYCDAWAKAGFCNRPNLIYHMRVNCRLTCGFC